MLPFLPVRQPRKDSASTSLSTNGGWWKARLRMIDNFSLALTHGLMALAAWYLLRRDDLDRETSPNDAEAKPRRGRWGGRNA